MIYVYTLLQTPATDRIVLVRGRVCQTQPILQKDIAVHAIMVTKEITVKLVGQTKYFDKDMKISPINMLLLLLFLMLIV